MIFISICSTSLWLTSSYQLDLTKWHFSTWFNQLASINITANVSKAYKASVKLTWAWPSSVPACFGNLCHWLFYDKLLIILTICGCVRRPTIISSVLQVLLFQVWIYSLKLIIIFRKFSIPKRRLIFKPHTKLRWVGWNCYHSSQKSRNILLLSI